MNVAAILAFFESAKVFLAPLEALLKPELFKLETAGNDELKAFIASASSPDLKALLQGLDAAVDGFAQLEINKLP